MEDLPRDFFVDTKGHCFLCLEQIPDLDQDHLEESDSISSLQFLFHYLKLDLKEAFNERMSLLHPEVLALLGKSRLNVCLCERCGVINGRFSELYGQLERIRMQVRFCLGRIHGEMVEAEEGGKTERFRKLPVMTGGGCSKEEVEMVELIRNNAIRKCGNKLSPAPSPQVQIERLPLNEILQRASEEQALSPSSSINGDGTELIQSEGSFTFTDEEQEEEGLDQDQPYELEMEQSVPDPPATTSSPEIEVGHVKLDVPASGITDAEVDPTSSPDRDEENPSVPEVEVAETLAIKSDPTPQAQPASLRCKCCLYQATSALDLKEHRRKGGNCPARADYTFHPRTGRYTCNRCQKEFSTHVRYYTHHSAVHMRDRNRCNVCTRTFSRPDTLRKHQEMNFCSAPTHPAPTTAMEVVTVPSSNSNQEQSVPAPAPPPGIEESYRLDPETAKHCCTTCGAKFSHRSGFVKHFQREHLSMRWKCKLCGKQYPQRTSYVRHYESVHLKIRHRCDGCDKYFTLRKSLLVHQRFICDGKKGGTRLRKKTHLEEISPRGSEKVALLPSSSLVGVGDETEIGQLVSNSMEEGATEDRPEQLNPSSLQPSSTQSVSVLESEASTTTSEPPGDGVKFNIYGSFRCKRCPYQATSTSGLKEHRRGSNCPGRAIYKVHPETGKYKCIRCQKDFPTSGTFWSHHTGVHKRACNRCNVCTRTYSRADDLRKHQQMNICSPPAPVCPPPPPATAMEIVSVVASNSNCNLEQSVPGMEESYLLDPETTKHCCTTCGAKFTTRTRFVEHFQKDHLSMRWKCKLCKKLFNRRGSYLRHYKSVHLKIKHRCNGCDKFFSLRKSLRVHQRFICKGKKGGDNN